MTSFTFSLEQLKAAPPEVRRWVEHEIGVALGALGRLEHDPSQIHTPALAACTPEEALQMFDQIKENFLLAQVFFELARETPVGRVAPPLHALNLADLLRHTRLSDGDRLADCFTAINQIFQTVRTTPRRLCSVSTNTAMSTFTSRPTTASAACGSSCSSPISLPRAGRLPSA